MPLIIQTDRHKKHFCATEMIPKALSSLKHLRKIKAGNTRTGLKISDNRCYGLSVLSKQMEL